MKNTVKPGKFDEIIFNGMCLTLTGFTVFVAKLNECFFENLEKSQYFYPLSPYCK